MPKTQFDLYWSPEGRKIATVMATSAREAVKMAPKPYRKFLGEIYAKQCGLEIKVGLLRHSADLD